MIDFPQMISTSHENATEYFMRDVKGLQASSVLSSRPVFRDRAILTPVFLQLYFSKKYGVEASWSPEDLPKFTVGEVCRFWGGPAPTLNSTATSQETAMDVELRTSGFSRDQAAVATILRLPTHPLVIGAHDISSRACRNLTR